MGSAYMQIPQLSFTRITGRSLLSIQLPDSVHLLSTLVRAYRSPRLTALSSCIYPWLALTILYILRADTQMTLVHLRVSASSKRSELLVAPFC